MNSDTFDISNVVSSFVIILVIVVLITIFTIKVIWMSKGEKAICNNINNLYIPTNLASVNATDVYSHPINFYYIKTAYNCCSGGAYTNNFVSLCILEKIITQGVRCFDFELFNKDEVAIVSTSLYDDPYTKETINFVYFEDAMETIATQAFNNNYCTNSTDPIFISLRINSNHKSIYDNIADTLTKYTDKLLLNEYSVNKLNNKDNKFFSTVLLKDVMKKMVIMVYSTSKELDDSRLMEFVNVITFASPYFKYEKYSVLKADHDDETIAYTKDKMLFVTPTIENGVPINPETFHSLKTGVQFIGMSYQYLDDNLQAYQSFFDKYKHAFILKNKLLLPIKYLVDITIPGEESNPNQCQEIKMGDKVIGSFGSGCAK